MKLIVILITIVCVQVSAKGYAQLISMSESNITLKNAFRKIEKQSGYSFFYKGNLIKNTEISVKLTNATINQALETILKDQSLSYSILDKTVIIKPEQIKKQIVSLNLESPVIKDIKVDGKVFDENGRPIGDVNVKVKDGSQEVRTSSDGSFSINVPNKSSILVFSFVGYLTKEVQAGSKELERIILNIAKNDLEAVVVVGYGVQKKANLTGAISSISASDLQSRPIAATSSSLQGLLPGVTIVNASGKPGGNNTTIRIRGIGTTNNPNPLILIDGIEGSMDLLNPDDIESISVLKDAASSAIYGSRGANGILLITTKKGSSTTKEPIISYNGYSGYQQPTRLQKYVGSVEYMEMQNEALTNVGRPTSFTTAQIQAARDGSDPNNYSNTNWVNEIFRDQALQQNHAISANGGGEKSSYYLSYGYLNQQGLIVGNAVGADRHNLRLRLNTTVLKAIDVDGNIGYVYRSQTDPAIGLTGNTGVIYSAHEISPLVPVKFTTGLWGHGGGVYNPVSIATDGGRNKFLAQDITANLNVGIKLSRDLRLKGLYGMVFSNSTNNILTRKVSYYNPLTGNVLSSNIANNKIELQNYNNQYQNLSTQLDYNHNWGKHGLQGLFGASQEWNTINIFGASREGLLNEELPVLNVAAGNILTPVGNAGDWAIRSLFSRFNYNYAGKYLLEANLRYDGSSRFAKDKRWGAFPSVSAGWRISEEKFMEPLKKSISDLKIRVSWGMLGNQYLTPPVTVLPGAAYSSAANAGLYPYMASLSIARSMPINVSAGSSQTDGFQQTISANPILTWEKVKMQNIGLDLQMFNNRLSFSGDYFIKKTDGILLTVALPDVLGIAEPPQNAGAVDNRGWEVSLGWKDKIGSFNYGLFGSLTDVKNKVTSLGGGAPTIGDRIRIVGMPIDAFYGLVAKRIAQEEDFTYDAVTKKYTPKFPIIAGDAANIKPGDLIYQDLDGDNAITLDKDRKVIGNAFPRYSYAFRGDFGWKGIDVSFFLQGVNKADGYIQGNGRHAFYNEASFPQEMHRDRWTPTNTDASYPRFTYLQNHNRYLSTFWLENAAYLRLKNVQLGYTFPLGTRFGNHVQKLRLYFSGENMFTKTKFLSAYDPETPFSDGGLYPQLKTYVIGLNLMLK